MSKTKFEFIESYRTMMPSANQDIIAAREAGHEKLYAEIKSMAKVYDLCRLAFQMTYDPSSLIDWFEATIRPLDPRFSIEKDGAEAGRIAVLLLRDLMSHGSPQGALAVLSTSYCARRASIDGGELLALSREAIRSTGKDRRMVAHSKEVTFSSGKDFKPEFDALQTTANGPNIRAALEAVTTDLREGGTKMAASINELYKPLHGDTIRLAEEVDMLWWHIGDWSELLDRPRSKIPENSLGLVSGIELGEMVRQVPGPYGAYGILHRTVGKLADKKLQLKEAIDGLDRNDIRGLTRTLPADKLPLFPVHAAMHFASERGPEVWAAAFDDAVKDIKGIELTHYELALQAFRERVLIVYGGLN